MFSRALMSLCFRLQALSEKLERFHVLVDHDRGIDRLISNDPGAGKQWLVWLKVDCGGGRGTMYTTVVDHITAHAHGLFAVKLVF